METDPEKALCAYQGVVEYEHLDTWPTEIMDLFEREFSSLEAYEDRRAEVDAEYRLNVMVRINPPENVHQQRRDEVVLQADAILTERLLLCFHCTRLTEAEVAQIRAEGLRPLDPALIREKLNKAVSQKLLAKDLAGLLLKTHQADNHGRAGMTHFVNCRSFLSCEGEVGRLFRSWGGEALYCSHEAREDTGPALRRIGTPAIIVTAAPVQLLGTAFQNIGERFLWKFLYDRNVPTGEEASIETHSTEPVPANMILEVITYADSRFEQLTSCSTWSQLIG